MGESDNDGSALVLTQPETPQASAQQSFNDTNGERSDEKADVSAVSDKIEEAGEFFLFLSLYFFL